MTTGTSSSQSPARFGTLLGLVLCAAALLAMLYETTLKGRPAWERVLRRTPLASDESLAGRAHEQLWAGRLEGPEGAVEAFTMALRRDPASPYRWCELGETLLEAGRVGPARYCLRRAVELGGGTPSVLMRAANLHFRLGESRQALAYTRRILAMTPDFDAIIFSSYTRLEVSAGEALSQGVPADRRTAQSFFRYLLGGGLAGEAGEVWPWVTRHSFASDRLADEYAAFLLGQRQYEEAVRVWAAHLGPRGEGFPDRNRLFNGGFEREPAGETFDWRMTRLEGVEVERDASVAASGRWSLRLRFEGRENLDYRHVVERAVLRPGPWRLEALVRTAEITTDQGIGFEIVDAEDARRLEVKTERLLGTRDWTRIDQTFVARPQSRLVEVRVIREPSLKFDSKIRGTAWIDEVRLVPAGAR